MPATAPDRFVGVTPAGEVVVADARSGDPLVAVTTVAGVDASRRALDVGPAGEVLYLARDVEACASEIISLDLRTGEERRLVRSDAPIHALAVSPDGSRLAWSSGGAECELRPELVVTRSDTMQEQVWQGEGEQGLVTRIGDIAWSSGQDALLVEFDFEDGETLYHVDLDAASDRELPEPTRLDSGDEIWATPAAERGGTFVISSYDIGAERPTRLLRYAHERQQFSPIVEFGTRMRVASVVTDPSGEHLLLILREGRDPDTSQVVTYRLDLTDPRAEPVPVSESYVDVAW